MSGRKESTREAVHRVANEILKEGKLPTGREVHARIGTGSFQTIYSELEHWARATADRADLPGIPDSVRDGFVGLWEVAVQAALQISQPHIDQVNAQLVEKDHQIAALQAQLDEAVSRLNTAFDDHEQALASVQALQARVSELAGSEALLRQQLEGLRQEVTVERRKADQAQAFFQEETKKAESQFRALEDKTLQELDQVRQSARLKVEALEASLRREQAASARRQQEFEVRWKQHANEISSKELAIQNGQASLSLLREEMAASRAREAQLASENVFLKEQQAILTAMFEKINPVSGADTPRARKSTKSNKKDPI